MTTAAPTSPMFTVDWLTDLLPSWRERLRHLSAQREVSILEIGVFEGRATRWLLDTFPQATVTAIDPFLGGDDQRAMDLAGLRDRFDHNTAEVRDRLGVWPMTSAAALPQLIVDRRRYDFIYIDGSHHAADVLFDAVCALQLLSKSGRICFDDFTWQPQDVPAWDTPRPAILAFLQTHHDRVRVLGNPDRQLWVERTR